MLEGLSTEQQLELFRRMLLIRRFDQRAIELLAEGKIFGPVHPYWGQEAVAVGIGHFLAPEDKLITYHRGHGHSIVKGTPLRGMMAELLGREDGCCKGKGGSMHITELSVGMLGANGIVGAGIPHAVGVALSEKMRSTSNIVACFFGDGATGAGVLYESLNIAALWSLPVVFICENNQYASGTPTTQILARDDVAGIGETFEIPNRQVDGTDLFAVLDAAEWAVGYTRGCSGPTLIECKTYRFGVHAQRGKARRDSRPDAELAAAMEKDPISFMRNTLQGAGVLTDEAMEAIGEEVNMEIQDALEFAESSPWPVPESALDDVFAR